MAAQICYLSRAEYSGEVGEMKCIKGELREMFIRGVHYVYYT